MAQNKNDERDPVQLSLGNTVIFRHILTYLPFKDLKSCSEVNKTWNYEVQTYIRDFRVCNVTIAKGIPCVDLERLNEAVGQMNHVIPINSLTINRVSSSDHSICNAGAYDDDETYVNLMKKLPLKHFDVSWYGFGDAKTCPATVFISKLLLKRSGELHSLRFRYFATQLNTYFNTSWAPLMPKLKVLDFSGAVGWARVLQDLFLRMIHGAPNVKKIRGIDDPHVLKILPEEKYCLLDTFRLSVRFPVERQNSMKVAQAGPQLSRLYVVGRFPVGAKSFGPNFYPVLERLLQSSETTLTELSIEEYFLPLGQLNFPPLVNLKTLRLFPQKTCEKLLRVLKSIDYPRLLPSLRKVQVNVILDDIDSVDAGDAPVPDDDLPHENLLYPSETVSELKIEIDINQIRLQDLQPIFPALTSLEVSPHFLDSCPTPYEYIWEKWPKLESMQVSEGAPALAQNFDAAFLGIYPAELEYLLGQYDEFLLNYHLVPIRPSLLSMKNLKNLEVSFQSEEIGEDLKATNRVFLSRVPGFLALHRTRSPNLQVRLITEYEDTELALEHLKPFATVCQEV